MDVVWGVAQHHLGNPGQQHHKQQLAPQGGGEESSLAAGEGGAWKNPTGLRSQKPE